MTIFLDFVEVRADAVAPRRRCWLFSESLRTKTGNEDLSTSFGLKTPGGELGETESALNKMK